MVLDCGLAVALQSGQFGFLRLAPGDQLFFFLGPHTWGINEKGPLQAAATRRESMSAKGGNVKIKAG